MNDTKNILACFNILVTAILFASRCLTICLTTSNHSVIIPDFISYYPLMLILPPSPSIWPKVPCYARPFLPR